MENKLFSFRKKLVASLSTLLVILWLLAPYRTVAQCPGTVNLALASSPCRGAALTFNNTSTGTADSYTWKWGDGTGDTGPIPGTTAQNHTFINAGTYTVELEKRCGGNTDKKSISVTIVNFPNTPTLSANPANPCGQQDVTLNITNAQPGVTYTWNFGDVASGSKNTATGTSVTHAFSPTGADITYNVTATAQNAQGCQIPSNTFAVNTKSTPKINISDNSTFLETDGNFARCQTNSNSIDSIYTFKFGNNSLSDATTLYTWNWGDGTAPTPVTGTAEQAHEYKKFGVSNLILTAKNNTTACIATLIQNVVNEKAPIALLGIPFGKGDFCATEPFTVNNLSTNATFYTWSWGDGDTTKTDKYESVIHKYNLSKQDACTIDNVRGKQFIINLISNNSCFSHFNTSPVFVKSEPLPTITINSDKNICKTSAGSTHTVNFSTSVCPTPNIFQTQVKYNFGDPASGASNESATFTLKTGLLAAVASHTYSTAGMYVITVTATNSCGTTETKDTIYLLNTAVASFTEGSGTKNSGSCSGVINTDFTPASDCGPFTLNLKNTSTNLTPSDNISWTVSPAATFGSSNGSSSNSKDDNIAFTNPGQYTVKLSVKNTCNGPIASESCAIVNVKGIPQISGAGTSIGGFSGAGANPNFVPGTGADAGKFVACGTQNVTQLTVNNPDATVNGYQWSVSPPVAIPSPTQQNPGVVSFAPGDYEIKANVKNTCGNVDLPAVKVKITTPPVVNAGGTPPPGGTSACPGGSGISGVGSMKEVVVCSGVDASLGAGAAVNGVTYAWTTVGNPAPATPNQPTTNVNITNTGTSNTCHKYIVEANNTVCKNRDSILVVVKPAPAVNIGSTGATGTNADTSICISAGDFNLFAQPTGGTWTSTTAGAVVGTSFKTSAADTGLHTLAYKYQDPGPGGCEITKTKKININALPNVSVSLEDSYCESSTPFSLSGSPADGTWSSPVVGAITPQGSFKTSEVGAGNSVELTYSFTDANTCTNTAKKTVSIVAPAKPNPGAAVDSICKNAPALQLSGFSPAGGTWSGSVVTTGGSFNPSTLNAGEYVLTYTINAGTPCVQDTSKKIVVKPIPTVSTGSYGPFCEDAAPVKLSGTPAGGTWTGPAGAITIVGSDTLFDPKTAGKSSGHTLSYAFTNEYSCSVTNQTSIEVKELPAVNAGPDITICINPTAYDLTGFNTVAGGTSTWKKLSTGTTNTISNAAKFAPNQTGKDTLEYTIAFAGCSSSDTIIVTVVDPVQAEAGSNDSLCVDAGIFNFAPGAATTFVPANGSRWEGPGVVAGTNTFDPQALTAAQLNKFNKYYYFYGGGNCITKDSIEIKTFSLPTITPPTTPAGVLCEDVSPMIISGYKAETPGQSAFDSTFGAWSGPGITQIAGSQNYRFDPNAAGPSAAPYQLEYTYTDARTKDCQSVFKLPITVAPLPVADITVPAVYCVNVELNVTNNSTVSIGSLDKNNWNWGTGAPGAVQTGLANANGKFTYTAPGDYQITFTVISAAGCDSTISKNIKIITPPTAKFEFVSFNPPSLCGPLEVLIRDQSTGFDSTYQWNFGNGTTSNSYIPGDTSITYLQGRITDTLYYVTLMVSNLCATDTLTDSVRVYPKPFVVFGTDKNEGCSAAPINFTNNSLGIIQGQPTSYLWKFGDGTPDVGPLQPVIKNGERFEPDPGTHWFSYEGFNDTTYTITLVAENACGIDSAKRSVKVFPNNVKAFFNQSVNAGCSPLAVDYTDFSTGGTYVAYNFGDGSSIIEKNVTKVFENTDSLPKVFRVYQYVNNGCSYDTTDQDITVYPQPKVDFSLNKEVVCRNEQITLLNNSPNINNSRWNMGDGSVEIKNITTNVRYRYDTVGIFTISLIGKENAHQCEDTAYKTITVKSLPVPAFTASDTTGCRPLTIQFTNNSSTDAEKHVWNFGDGNPAATPAPAHTYNNPGTYWAALKVENADGCVDSTKVRIRVFATPDIAFNEVSFIYTCSFPAVAGYRNLSSPNALGFTWKINNVTKSTEKDALLPFDTSGTFEVMLVGKTADECYDSAKMIKNINHLPVAEFNVASGTGCYPYSAIFTNTSSFAQSFFWDFGDNTVGNANTKELVHVYDEGLYDVSLTAISADGCRNTLSKPAMIAVNPRPEADFSYELEQDPQLYGTVYFTNKSRNALSYQWNYGDGTLTDTDSLKLTHRYALFGNKEVSLIATNSFNCKDTATQQVNVPFFGGLFVPNAFTPDYGEEAVRFFKPVGKGLEKYSMRVYDTWGILIWESTAIDADTGPAEGWDGTKNGVPLPQDVYVWKAEATFFGAIPWQGMDTGKGKLRKTGTVTLIR